MVDRTAEFDAKDAQENKVFGIFSYIGILVLVSLFARKESKWTRFHVNQGLVIAICEIVAGTVLGILSRIPYVGWVFNLVLAAVEVVAVIVSVLGIVQAAKGQAKELPVIGQIKLLK